MPKERRLPYVCISPVVYAHATASISVMGGVTISHDTPVIAAPQDTAAVEVVVGAGVAFGEGVGLGRGVGATVVSTSTSSLSLAENRNQTAYHDT